MLSFFLIPIIKIPHFLFVFLGIKLFFCKEIFCSSLEEASSSSSLYNRENNTILYEGDVTLKGSKFSLKAGKALVFLRKKENKVSCIKADRSVIVSYQGYTFKSPECIFKFLENGNKVLTCKNASAHNTVQTIKASYVIFLSYKNDNYKLRALGNVSVTRNNTDLSAAQCCYKKYKGHDTIKCKGSIVMKNNKGILKGDYYKGNLIQKKHSLWGNVFYSY